MKALIIAVVPVLAVTWLDVGSAAAQPPIVYPGARPNPYIQPPVSPYVNMGTAGVNPAAAYFGVVRPQQNFYAGLNYLNQQNYATQQSLYGLQYGDQGVATGFHAGFMTQSRYFMNNNALAPLNAGGPGNAPERARIGNAPQNPYVAPRAAATR